MSRRVKKHAYVLKALAEGHPTLRKIILEGADKELLECLTECAYNVLKGTVPLTKAQLTKLTRHKQHLREVAKPKTTQKRKKEIFQTGGFLPLLLAPLVVSVLGRLVKGVTRARS